MLYLAFLAPDIVEKFVRGEQPIELGVKRLLAMAPLPMDWAEQPGYLASNTERRRTTIKGRRGHEQRMGRPAEGRALRASSRKKPPSRGGF